MAFFAPLIVAAASAALSKAGQKKSNATDTLRSVDTPALDDLKVKLEQYVQVGLLDPEDAQTILQEQSAYNTISTDPRLRQQQMGALSQINQTAEAGGLDAVAMADLEDVLGRQRAASRGDQLAIMGNARARGLAGSDLEFVNRMIAQQQQATAGSRNALDVAALRQTRRDEALQQQAALAGNIRNQDFGEQAQKAAAADAVARFNAANRQAQVNRNVDTRNEARSTNLGAAQAINSANVDLRNQQQQYNKGLPLDLYQAKLGHAGQLANAQNASAGLAANQAQSQSAGFGQTAATLADLYKKKDGQ